MARSRRGTAESAPEPLPRWVRVTVAILTPLAPLVAVCVEAFAK
ncbi:hypothetical protein AB0E62_05925 [Streptomyces sp. NPDC038707]